MALPNIPGLNVDFPTQQVRDGLLFAMQLGKPSDTTRQVTFIRKVGTVQFFLGSSTTPLDPATVRKDRDGRPLNPDIRVEQAADEEIKVDVAIEVEPAEADELPVGNFRPTKAVVTLMAQEYEKVRGCRELRYNADRYVFGYEPQINGLFDLDFHTMIFYAIDES